MTVAQRRNMTLSKLIGRFKMLSSKRINQSRNPPGARLWQRNYWEHIVRDEPELQRLREYIQNNPIRWETDTLYSPARAPWITDAWVGDVGMAGVCAFT
uniref:Transposase IS200 like n=1 Tax=Candidatus Kentrum sp. LPFa TaxID=2126335 RepID=A0A450WG63_9GAMM|nr:MAG: Transposase IS200 like [Candidatus Kentron sp. LPFa]